VCSEKRIVQQAYRFEIAPNQTQRELLAKSVGASRYVYNWGLAESRRANELTGKRPGHRELKKQLVGLKRSDAPWLYEVSAHIGQQALVDLDHAFQRFFKGLKGDGSKSGFPRFKRKGERDLARLYEITLEERHLRMPNIGRVRLKETCSERGFRGRILSATITRRADRWFVSICVELEREIPLPKPIEGKHDVVGVDLGLTWAAVIHDGAVTRAIEPRRALRKNLTKLRQLDRQLARKQKGSGNRDKAKLARARLHYRISCQRQDMLHKLSSELARTKSVVVLEDLHVRGLQRNRHLALSISDAGMGKLRRQLVYKSEWYGTTLVIADRFFPPSKLCSGCGVIKPTLELGERRFDCDACGASFDRDVNASINLRAYGANQLGIVPLPADRREVTPVGEESSGARTTGAKPASMKQEATANGTRPSTRRSTRKHVLVRIERDESSQPNPLFS
jgi:putative transposase